jgi:ABC-type glycerol-3-phosphate transport system substrate-binding protein
MDVGIGLNKSLSKDSAKMDAAIKLVKYMTVGKGQEYFCGKPGAGLIPVKKGLGLNMSVYDNASNKEGANNITTGFGKYFVGPREISSSAVKNQFAVVIQNIVNGADVKKELDSLQNMFEREE